MRTTIVLVHGAFAESASWMAWSNRWWRRATASSPRRTRCAASPRTASTTCSARTLPASQAALLAATQRPATQEALVEPSGEHPLWKDVPAWFLIGEEDRVIPTELQRYMAHRAGSQRTTVIEGASHAMPVSRPDATVHPILEAAALRATA